VSATESAPPCSSRSRASVSEPARLRVRAFARAPTRARARFACGRMRCRYARARISSAHARARARATRTPVRACARGRVTVSVRVPARAGGPAGQRAGGPAGRRVRRALELVEVRLTAPCSLPVSWPVVAAWVGHGRRVRVGNTSVHWQSNAQRHSEGWAGPAGGVLARRPGARCHGPCRPSYRGRCPARQRCSARIPGRRCVQAVGHESTRPVGPEIGGERLGKKNAILVAT
jgi:hypothetical protein